MTNLESKQPLVSIDVVPVRFFNGSIQVALGRRIFEPFRGQLALPGVLLLPNETIEEAARRALQSKVGLKGSDVLKLVQLGVFDNPDRDPRGPTISIAFVALISAEADSEESIWEPQNGNTRLPFDHTNIISAALEGLSIRLWRDADLTRALVGEEFSTAKAIAVTESISTDDVDRTNFTRMLKGYSHVERVESVAKSGKGRPSVMWRFA